MLREYPAESRGPNAFQDMRRAQEEVNRPFSGLRLAVRAETPLVNVCAGADGPIVTAQVAGVNPDQIDVTVHLITERK